MTKNNIAYSLPSDLQDWALRHWHLVDRLAHRRFRDETAAQEASLFVMDTMGGDDWRRLREFSGKARFSTFFCSVAYRLLEDYARKKYGRLRAPAWLTRLGGIWLYFFRLLCMERYPVQEAVALAQNRYPKSVPDNSQAIAEQILTKIPSCGKKQSETVPFDDDHSVAHVLTRHSEQQDKMEDDERRQLFAALAIQLYDEETTEHSTAPLAALITARIRLSDRERLLLKLCHREGISVTEAGRVLGLNRFQVHGQLKRLYARIREQLTNAGLAQELHELLMD